LLIAKPGTHRVLINNQKIIHQQFLRAREEVMAIRPYLQPP
jgi:hypothetical protein